MSKNSIFGSLPGTTQSTFDTLVVNGDANLGSGTLFVDESTNRVGINEVLPDTDLHLFNSGDCTVLIESGATSNSRLGMGDSADTDEGFLDYDNNTQTMTMGTAATTAITIDSGQDVTLAGDLTVTGTVTGADLTSGTYSPTLTTSTRVLDVTQSEPVSFLRVGELVTITGTFEADFDSGGARKDFYMTLPVASVFTNNADLVAGGNQIGAHAINLNRVEARQEPTNDEIEVRVFMTSGGAINNYTFAIRVDYVVSS